VAEISRQQGVSQAAFCKWRQPYNGMDASELKRLKAVYAEMDVDLKVAKKIIEKKL
jgi:putative transposase